MRLALLAVAIIALIIVAADYLHRAKPSIAAVAIESGLTASHRMTDADIAADDALTDDYWRGQGYAMAHPSLKVTDCPDETEAFRRGCADVVSGRR